VLPVPAQADASIFLNNASLAFAWLGSKQGPQQASREAAVAESGLAERAGPGRAGRHGARAGRYRRLARPGSGCERAAILLEDVQRSLLAAQILIDRDARQVLRLVPKGRLNGTR
jgi:hypothetical protein